MATTTLPQFTHTVSVGLSGVTAKTLTGKVSASGNSEDGRSIDIPAGAVNQAVTFNLTVANMQSFFLVADGALTIKANSTSVPDYTLSPVAGTPIWWMYGQGMTNPVTANTTTLYVSNAGSASVRLDVTALQNS
jgi:hypothetical protein